MGDTDGILYRDKDDILINYGKFYDNLKIIKRHNDNYAIKKDMHIYEASKTYFKNAIIEIFKYLHEGIKVSVGNEMLNNMKDFEKWLYSKNNLELGIDVYKDFIERTYTEILKK